MNLTSTSNDTDENRNHNVPVYTLLVFLSVFGTLGNSLVLLVYTKKKNKKASTIFILSLAWCDLFNSFVTMPVVLAFVILDHRCVYDVICKMYAFLITCNVPLSVFIMVAVAVDRYCSICHPFLLIMTPRRAKVSILCLCLLAFCLGIMSACFHGVYHAQSIQIDNCSSDMSSSGTIVPIDLKIIINNNKLEMPEQQPPWKNNSLEMPEQQPPWKNNSLEMHEQQPPWKNNSLEMPEQQPPWKNNSLEMPEQQPPWKNNSLEMPEQQPPLKNRTFDSIIRDTEEISQNPPCTWKFKEIFMNIEWCSINTVIFSSTFMKWYQQVYSSFFIISIVSASILYILIFHTVVKGRRWRRRNASFANSVFVKIKPDEKNDRHDDKGSDIVIADDSNAPTKNTPTTYFGTLASANHRVDKTDNKIRTYIHDLPNVPQFSSCSEKKTFREKWDLDFLANIRTAAMLFVVTVVFIICFVPAWLMVFRILKFNVFIYYLYFVNNVANPVIYAFMNKHFRKELKLIFHRCNVFCR